MSKINRRSHKPTKKPSRTITEKLQIISLLGSEAYPDNTKGRTALATEYNVHERTIRDWIKQKGDLEKHPNKGIFWIASREEEKRPAFRSCRS